MRLLLRDPVTRKKSLTVSLIVLFSLLFTVSFILHIFKILEWKSLMTMLIPLAFTFAAYQQKRVKIGFTGLEFSGKGR